MAKKMMQASPHATKKLMLVSCEVHFPRMAKKMMQASPHATKKKHLIDDPTSDQLATN
jgi:hypothetical protein